MIALRTRILAGLRGRGTSGLLAAFLMAWSPMGASRTALHAQDTLTLGALHALAERADARATQLRLLAEQSALRQASLKREALPTLGATASSTYLSDVPSLPGGAALGPLNQQYDSYVSARSTLFDPTRTARLLVEEAQLLDAQAGVRSALWQVRAQVNDSYFGILLRQAQQRTIEAGITDLEERRRIARARVEGGVALASEATLLDAELARRAQLLLEARLDEAALRDVLGSLIGREVGATTVLALPASESPLLPQLGRDRPEYAQYAASRNLLARREAVMDTQLRPRVALVGRGGYGRPGLNALGREFDTYYTVGVQLEWSPFNWGVTAREREVQHLQARIVDTYETNFAAALARFESTERHRINALELGLRADSGIIVLRESVLQETRLRYDEGDVSAADYVMRLTDALNARLDFDTRSIRLAEARARYLTTLGREVR